jgi:tetratricopeptide (TPR) repeat protein
LEFIGRNSADLRLLILSIFRPPDHRRSPLAWAARLPHYSQISLAEFTPVEAKQLIRSKLTQLFGLATDAPAELIEQIQAKAQGNPFYIEEILNYMNDRGLDPQNVSTPQALNLPDSLHSLILSRIDQLAESEKTTLKVASIIGRVFKASWLWGSYPALGSPEMVKQHLETLNRLDITPLDKPEPELEYLFKHITIQEVAYDSLAFAMRETLHEAVGRFIEQAYADSLAQYLDILAYHYGRSPNMVKQRLYFRQAGDAAKATYANQVAIDYYQRLLPLLAEREKIEVMRRLGEVWQVVGHWSEAENIFQQALALAQSYGDRAALAHCQNALGHLLSHSESYQEALVWLEKARGNFEQLAEPIGLCRTLEYLSFIYAEQGDYGRALTYSEQQHRLAGEANDQIGVSAALGNIGVAYWNQGDYRQAQLYLDQALDIAVSIGYQRGVILTGNDRAGLHWQLGEYHQAVAGLQQALRVAAEIGDLRNVGMIVGNAGEIYRLRGDYAQALASYGQALHMAVELGDWTMMPYIIGNIAIVCAAQKRFQEAERLYLQAIALSRALNAPQALCEDLYHYARLCALQQHYAEAYPLNQEALTLAGQVSRKDIQFPASLLAVRLQVALAQIDPATAASTLKTLANTWPEDNEQAAIQYELWRLDKSCDEARQMATCLYQRLYDQTFNIEYRHRYEEMTGERLANPPPLPLLSDHFEKSPINLADLLQQVGVLIENLVVEKDSNHEL